MKVAVVQTSPEFGEVTKNVEKAVGRIRVLKADLVVLPELFSTGYQFRSKKEALSLAEPVKKGYTVKALTSVAAECDTFIVAGLAERAGRGGKVFNSAVLIGPAGLIGLYRKAHLFWNEKNIFSPGDSPFEVFDIGQARIGIMICYDWVFPEVARILARKGAEIICHPSNLVLPHCPDAMITRSLENRVFSITSNRVGSEKRIKDTPLRFIGKSQIVSPGGELLFRAERTGARAGTAVIEPKEARNKGITPNNDIFSDLREDLLKA